MYLSSSAERGDRPFPPSRGLTARGPPHPARILAFQPECNPPTHTTPASRAPGSYSRPPLAVVMGSSRRSLAPAATNAAGAASRTAITSSGHTIRHYANRYKTLPTTPPAAARDSSAHDQAGPLGSATHTKPIADRDSHSGLPQLESGQWVAPPGGPPPRLRSSLETSTGQTGRG